MRELQLPFLCSLLLLTNPIPLWEHDRLRINAQSTSYIFKFVLEQGRFIDSIRSVFYSYQLGEQPGNSLYLQKYFRQRLLRMRHDEGGPLCTPLSV